MRRKKPIIHDPTVTTELPSKIYAYLRPDEDVDPDDECECKKKDCLYCFPTEMPKFEVETTDQLKEVPVEVEVGVYELMHTGEMKKTFLKGGK